MTTTRLDGRHRSSSPKAAADASNAEEVLRRRRVDEGRTFRSVEQALAWYLERRELQQGPKGLHPRGESGPGGETVILDVDGGRGGDLDGDLVTLSTIAAALEALHHDEPQWYEVLQLKEIGDSTARAVRVDVVDWAERYDLELHRAVDPRGAGVSSKATPTLLLKLRNVGEDVEALNALRPKEREARLAELLPTEGAEAAATKFGVSAGAVRAWQRRIVTRKGAGLTFAEIGERFGMSQSTASFEHGKAISYLRGWLKGAGVVRA